MKQWLTDRFALKRRKQATVIDQLGQKVRASSAFPLVSSSKKYSLLFAPSNSVTLSLFIAEPAGKARQRSSIAKEIWYPIKPRNCGCDVIVT